MALPVRLKQMLLRSTAAAVLSGAQTLLASETDGLAFDFTDITASQPYGSGQIKDTATPANAWTTTTALTPFDKLTFARTSNAMCFGSTGLLKFAPHNLLLNSGDPDATCWTSVSTNVSYAQSISDPAGGSGATRITATSANGRVVQAVSGVLVAVDHVFKVYLRRAAGTGPVRWESVNVGAGAEITLTSSWAEYTFSSGITLASTTFYAGLRIDTSGDAVDVYIPHVYRTPMHETNGGFCSTYVQTTSAAVYRPRIDYNPSTLAVRGLLMEEARTNLCLYSQDLSNAAWAVSSGAAPVSTNNSDIFGTNTACRFTWNGSGNDFRYQSITISNTTTYTASFYARSADSNTYTIGLRGLAGGSNSLHVVTPTRQRFTYTWTSSGTSWSFGFEFRPGVVAGVSAAGSVIIEGCQLEAGAFATSLIPTTSASATRAAESVSLSTSAFNHSATAGTVYVSGTQNSLETGNSDFYFNFSDGTANEQVMVRAINVFTGRITDGGAQQLNVNSGAIVNLTPTPNNVSIAWASNDAAFYANGTQVGTSSSVTLPTITTLRIGTDQSGSGTINGHIRKVMHLPRRMSNAGMQTLTT